MSKGLNGISKNGEYNAHIKDAGLVKLIKLCAKSKGLTTIDYVVNNLRKRSKTAGGFIWKYKEEM